MATKDRWFIPTNTENLKIIIAQGLIPTHKGFKKYYSDVLELLDGYIPLFKNEVSQDILTYVVSEENNLTPVFIEIELKKITGRVKKNQENRLVDIDLKDIEDIEILFIQAPLPLSVISTILFQSKSDKKVFEDDSKLYSNVVLADLKLSSTLIEQKLFKINSPSKDLVNYFKKIEIEDSDEVDYHKVYAYGGVLFNLFYFAKNGKLSHDAYQQFCSLEEERQKEDIEIYGYFRSLDKANSTLKKKMDYGLINIAIHSINFKEDVLDFLLSDIWDEKTKRRTKELADTLKRFESNSDKTVSEHFCEAKTPLEKVLLMLFLREDSDALMDYSLELFSEEDYINFAMMFGIRDKFIKIPKVLREFSGVQNFISLKMAAYAHESIKSNIEFKSLVKPLTFMDMFNKNNLKKRLIKAFKLENTIETILPNKEYYSKRGINTYSGFIEPKYELLEDEYFKVMYKKRVTTDEYNKFAK